MKPQKLSNCGFILIEAALGVALFSLLLVTILQGISFMVGRVAVVAHRHKALCEIALALDDVPYNPPVTYTHPSVVWYRVTALSGTQALTLYRARNQYAH